MVDWVKQLEAELTAYENDARETLRSARSGVRLADDMDSESARIIHAQDLLDSINEIRRALADTNAQRNEIARLIYLGCDYQSAIVGQVYPEVKRLRAKKSGRKSGVARRSQSEDKKRRYIETVQQIKKEHPAWNLTGIREEAASRCKVSRKTIEKYTKGLDLATK